MSALLPPDSAETLKKTMLLGDFADAAIAGLLPYFEARSLQAGEFVFADGDENAALCIVRRGTCAVEVNDKGKARRAVGLKQYETVGELSLLLHGSRHVSVKAEQPVELLVLDHASFGRLKRANPDLCILLIMAIVRRFGRLIDNTHSVLKQAMIERLQDA